MTRRALFITLSLAAVVGITGFIFFNSFKDFAASHHISDPVTQIVDHYVEKPQNLDLSYLIRKAAHWIEFSALGAAVCCLIQSMGNEKKTLLGYGLFYLLLVGVADEYWQSFSDRSSLASDVLLDFAGAIFGFVVLLLARKGWLALKNRLQKGVS